jgi:hypothetical protein
MDVDADLAWALVLPLLFFILFFFQRVQLGPGHRVRYIRANKMKRERYIHRRAAYLICKAVTSSSSPGGGPLAGSSLVSSLASLPAPSSASFSFGAAGSPKVNVGGLVKDTVEPKLKLKPVDVLALPEEEDEAGRPNLNVRPADFGADVGGAMADRTAAAVEGAPKLNVGAAGFAAGFGFGLETMHIEHSCASFALSVSQHRHFHPPDPPASAQLPPSLTFLCSTQHKNREETRSVPEAEAVGADGGRIWNRLERKVDATVVVEVEVEEEAEEEEEEEEAAVKEKGEPTGKEKAPDSVNPLFSSPSFLAFSSFSSFLSSVSFFSVFFSFSFSSFSSSVSAFASGLGCGVAAAGATEGVEVVAGVVGAGAMGTRTGSGAASWDFFNSSSFSCSRVSRTRTDGEEETRRDAEPSAERRFRRV